MSNRLAAETSPYLQQHKDNPVDWYPWGEEALARAKAEDRPILLSVGYSACHWCHVMEHESFADPETAALMNENFVNVKVDREERPDVDSLYMQAVQQMTGQGGWPMTVFLMPDGSPFYGGTYFPPQPRHGLPSFRQVLAGVAEAYEDRRDEVVQGADSLRDILARGMSINPQPESLDAGLLDKAFRAIAARFDPTSGGFGGAPKFPQPMVLDFLLRLWARTGNPDALRMTEQTLDAMARGGMYDHVGGGFHRYAVDARWLVPHFEKMQYDNALLTRVYLRGYQATGREDFRTVVEETLGFVLREMTHPEGGFFSSQDADSEGVEGKFYVWTADEIDRILGPDAEAFSRFYDVSEDGNWEGHNILNIPSPRTEMGRRTGLEETDLRQLLRNGRELLYAVRARRIWPGRDEKVITSWNAMMVQTFAEAGRVLDRGDWIEAAEQGAGFLLRELQRDGRLLRSWRDGEAKVDGFLEDHAVLVDALVEVYFATFEPRWVDEARTIADRMLERFWVPDQGLFFDTAEDGDQLVVRPRDIYDNATPAGTSAAVHALIRLARLSGEPEYERVAGRVMEGMGRLAAEIPQGFGNLLCAIEHHLAPPSEVALVGGAGDADTRALLATLRSSFLPHTTLALLPLGKDDDPGTATAIAARVPVLEDRGRRDGKATAYVCRNYTCNQPVTDPADLARQLTEIGPASARG